MPFLRLPNLRRQSPIEATRGVRQFSPRGLAEFPHGPVVVVGVADKFPPPAVGDRPDAPSGDGCVRALTSALREARVLGRYRSGGAPLIPTPAQRSQSEGGTR